ncbi:MAG TPA: glycosyltransferase family 1 protein [Candidatus Paceibacterota bacterium]|nr:glycosyltransferase family 1 protein [Candidatus Paceibacterota bacterium]
MTIALIADPCDPQKPGGLGRCIFELAKGLVEAAPKDARITVYSKSAFPVPGVAVQELSGNVWLSGARQIGRAHDVYVFFTPVIPLFFRPRKSIVIVEDLAYLELPRNTFREKLLASVSYRMHTRSLRLATRVVCISEATARSVERFFGVPAASCAIVPLAAMPFPAPSDDLPPLPPKFFLFAGVLKERKNIANIIRAFADFAKEDRERELVIAGRTGGAYYEELVALTRELGVGARVRFLGHMKDGQMAALYGRAEALVFVSKVEGFGMPVAEAFAAGLPVITSDRGAPAEVAGAAALLADPDSPGKIADAMRKLAHDPALAKRLAEAGRERVKAFSWEASGRALAELAAALGS